MVIRGNGWVLFRGFRQIPSRPFGGVRRQLHRPHLAAGHLADNGQPNRAGAGAQIDHTRMDHAVFCQPVKAGLHHGFGFRTRNEHSGTDLQVKVAERSMPGDVLQRLALGTAVEHGTEDGKLSGCAKFLPHKQSPVNVAQFNACRLGKEQLGIMLRRLNTRFAQLRRGLVDDVGNKHWRSPLIGH